jgi:hypothetical protein
MAQHHHSLNRTNCQLPNGLSLSLSLHSLPNLTLGTLCDDSRRHSIHSLAFVLLAPSPSPITSLSLLSNRAHSLHALFFRRLPACFRDERERERERIQANISRSLARHHRSCLPHQLTSSARADHPSSIASIHNGRS